jgi:hypothetical protein
MVMANATKVLDDMTWQIHHVAASIMSKIVRYDFQNPLLQEDITKRVGNIEVPVSISNTDFQGDVFDYFFEVEPYSMQRMSPEMKYQKTLQWVAQVVLPTLELGAQQGAQLNVAEFAQRTARYLDIDTSDLYLSQQSQETNVGAYQPMAGQSINPPKAQSGQSDSRYGTSSSNSQSDLNQQQARAFSQSSQEVA